LELVPGCAARNAEQADEKALEDEYGAKDYRSQMQLKSDYNSRPLWVVRIFLNNNIMLCQIMGDCMHYYLQY